MPNWTPEALSHAARLRNKKQLEQDAERMTARAATLPAEAPSADEVDKDSLESAEGSSASLHYVVSGKVHSTKNSRQNVRGKSFINPKAKAWLKGARLELAAQHRGQPLTGCYQVDLRIYYADGRGHCDLDNASSGLLDCLKGIVVVDDSPKYIGRLTVESEISRYARAHVEIVLREVV